MRQEVSRIGRALRVFLVFSLLVPSVTYALAPRTLLPNVSSKSKGLEGVVSSQRTVPVPMLGRATKIRNGKSVMVPRFLWVRLVAQAVLKLSTGDESRRGLVAQQLEALKLFFTDSTIQSAKEVFEKRMAAPSREQLVGASIELFRQHKILPKNNSPEEDLVEAKEQIVGLIEGFVKQGLIKCDNPEEEDNSKKRYKPVNAREFAVWAGEPEYIRKDLEKHLRDDQASTSTEAGKLSDYDQNLCNLLLEYDQVTKIDPRFPIELREPVLRAVELVDVADQAGLQRLLGRLEAAQKKLGRSGKETEVKNLVDGVLKTSLVDSIRLVWDAKETMRVAQEKGDKEALKQRKNRLKKWIAKNTPALTGRRTYYISPEIHHVKGGLGRVSKFHIAAWGDLGADVVPIEPFYRKYRDPDSGKLKDIDYNNVAFPIEIERDWRRRLKVVHSFQISCYDNEQLVTVEVYRGKDKKTGRMVYLLRDADDQRSSNRLRKKYSYDAPGSSYVKTLFEYGGDDDVSLQPFMEFFSKASYKLTRLLDAGMISGEKKAKKSSIIIANDGQCAMVPLWARVEKERRYGVFLDGVDDQEDRKRDPLSFTYEESQAVSGTPIPVTRFVGHTYKPRQVMGPQVQTYHCWWKPVFKLMRIPQRWHWAFVSGAVDQNIDPDVMIPQVEQELQEQWLSWNNIGPRTADGNNCVTGQHAADVQPYTPEVFVPGIRDNGCDLLDVAKERGYFLATAEYLRQIEADVIRVEEGESQPPQPQPMRKTIDRDAVLFKEHFDQTLWLGQVAKALYRAHTMQRADKGNGRVKKLIHDVLHTKCLVHYGMYAGNMYFFLGFPQQQAKERILVVRITQQDNPADDASDLIYTQLLQLLYSTEDAIRAPQLDVDSFRAQFFYLVKQDNPTEIMKDVLDNLEGLLSERDKEAPINDVAQAEETLKILVGSDSPDYAAIIEAVRANPLITYSTVKELAIAQGKRDIKGLATMLIKELVREYQSQTATRQIEEIVDVYHAWRDIIAQNAEKKFFGQFFYEVIMIQVQQLFGKDETQAKLAFDLIAKIKHEVAFRQDMHRKATAKHIYDGYEKKHLVPQYLGLYPEEARLQPVQGAADVSVAVVSRGPWDRMMFPIPDEHYLRVDTYRRDWYMAFAKRFVDYLAVLLPAGGLSTRSKGLFVAGSRVFKKMTFFLFKDVFLRMFETQLRKKVMWLICDSFKTKQGCKKELEAVEEQRRVGKREPVDPHIYTVPPQRSYVPIWDVPTTEEGWRSYTEEFETYLDTGQCNRMAPDKNMEKAREELKKANEDSEVKAELMRGIKHVAKKENHIIDSIDNRKALGIQGDKAWIARDQALFWQHYLENTKGYVDGKTTVGFVDVFMKKVKQSIEAKSMDAKDIVKVAKDIIQKETEKSLKDLSYADLGKVGVGQCRVIIPKCNDGTIITVPGGHGEVFRLMMFDPYVAKMFADSEKTLNVLWELEEYRTWHMSKENWNDSNKKSTWLKRYQELLQRFVLLDDASATDSDSLADFEFVDLFMRVTRCKVQERLRDGEERAVNRKKNCLVEILEEENLSACSYEDLFRRGIGRVETDIVIAFGNMNIPSPTFDGSHCGLLLEARDRYLAQHGMDSVPPYAAAGVGEYRNEKGGIPSLELERDPQATTEETYNKRFAQILQDIREANGGDVCGFYKQLMKAYNDYNSKSWTHLWKKKGAISDLNMFEEIEILSLLVRSPLSLKPKELKSYIDAYEKKCVVFWNKLKEIFEQEKVFSKDKVKEKEKKSTFASLGILPIASLDECAKLVESSMLPKIGPLPGEVNSSTGVMTEVGAMFGWFNTASYLILPRPFMKYLRKLARQHLGSEEALFYEKDSRGKSHDWWEDVRNPDSTFAKNFGKLFEEIAMPYLIDAKQREILDNNGNPARVISTQFEIMFQQWLMLHEMFFIQVKREYGYNSFKKPAEIFLRGFLQPQMLIRTVRAHAEEYEWEDLHDLHFDLYQLESVQQYQLYAKEAWKAIESEMGLGKETLLGLASNRLTEFEVVTFISAFLFTGYGGNVNKMNMTFFKTHYKAMLAQLHRLNHPENVLSWGRDTMKSDVMKEDLKYALMRFVVAATVRSPVDQQDAPRYMGFKRQLCQERCVELGLRQVDWSSIWNPTTDRFLTDFLLITPEVIKEDHLEFVLRDVKMLAKTKTDVTVGRDGVCKEDTKNIKTDEVLRKVLRARMQEPGMRNNRELQVDLYYATRDRTKNEAETTSVATKPGKILPGIQKVAQAGSVKKLHEPLVAIGVELSTAA